MVVFSQPAKDDLRHIYEFIAFDSALYAHKVIQSIVNHIQQLETFPESGRVVPELNDDSIREIIHDNYRIIYRIKNAIEVIAIIHAKRNFEHSINDRIE